MKLKYTAPTDLDKEIYGTICKEVTDDMAARYWIQCNENLETPEWIMIGAFFERVFARYLEDISFMGECLRLYKFNKDKPLHRISEILKDS